MKIRLAHDLVDAGADLILGHHPHVLQSVEHYKGAWIVYSLGNFLFDNSGAWQRRSALLSCDLKRGGIGRPRLLPVELRRHQPRLVKGARARRIQRRVHDLSRAYNATAKMRRGAIQLAAQTSQAGKASVPALRRWRPAGARHAVVVYPDRVELTRPDEEAPAAVLPMGKRRRFIRDAAISVELARPATQAHVFAIVGPPDQPWGKRLAVFPADLATGRFGSPLLDSHGDFRPWRVRVADLDGDGRDEILLGVFKSTRYHRNKARRLFVYGHRGGRIYPRWLGSQLAADLRDFGARPLGSDKKATLITWGRSKQGKWRATRHRWTGFGFDRATPLAPDQVAGRAETDATALGPRRHSDLVCPHGDARPSTARSRRPGHEDQ